MVKAYPRSTSGSSNPAIPFFEQPVEGELEMDGTEQILFEKTDDKVSLVEGMINLSSLKTGDRVIIREYMQTLSSGQYALYTEETFDGPHPVPLIQIATKISMHDIKITIQQTTGTNRTLEFSFTRRRVE